jgi:hypothetical protein
MAARRPRQAAHGRLDGPSEREQEVCVGMLAPECPRQPQLATLQAVDSRCTVLGAEDIDGRGIEMNLLPATTSWLTRNACPILLFIAWAAHRIPSASQDVLFAPGRRPMEFDRDVRRILQIDPRKRRV